MGGRISARSPIKFKLVWQRMNARCAEYKWAIEVCKTQTHAAGKGAAMLPGSWESGKFALIRSPNRGKPAKMRPKW